MPTSADTLGPRHCQIQEPTDYVHMPKCGRIIRSASVALTSASPNKDAANQFISLLKAEQGRVTFQSWERN